MERHTDALYIPPHFKGKDYIKDIVYGANDGIITTFAVVASVAGASLSPAVVILIGFANLLADGFSMAASNYLGTKSQIDVFKRERAIEEEEIRLRPESEKTEIKNILAKKGYEEEDLEKITELISKNKTFWADFMMQEELGLAPIDSYQPKRAAITTFLSFVIAGFLPIMPYLVLNTTHESIFLYAIIATALVLFVIGSLRSLFSQRVWYIAGGEMLFVGGFAAAIAYAVGFILKSIIG